MPQPIRRPCEVILGSLSGHPEHAAAIGSIVSVSGYLEALLGHLLAHLTGSSAAVTMAMFHAVTSTEAQRAMLTAAAEELLRGAELEEFRDIMSEFKTRYGERSRLVHNVWGWSPQHLDKALWCPSKGATAFSKRVASASTPEELNLLAHDEDVQLWKHCSTYTVNELQGAHDRLLNYTERVRQYVIELQNRHPAVQAAIAAQQATDEQAIEPPPETPPDQSLE